MRRWLVAAVAPIFVLLGIVTALPASADVVNGGTLTSGTPVTGTVTVANRDIQYTFAATNGGHITFDVTATNWGANGGAALRFYRPDGSGYDYCIVTTSPKYCEITPDVTGNWKMMLDPGDNSVGTATFTYAVDQNKGALTDGTAVTTTVGVHGQDAYYTFPATAGTHVTLNITASNWGSGSAYLYIFGPTGPLYSNCVVTITTICEFYPNATGTWRLQLDPYDTALGSTTFALTNDQNKGALTSGTPISTTIAIKGQNANYSFAGVSGVHSTFYVSATNWGAGSARLYFYQPNGTLWDYCILTASPISCDLTPTVTGTWRASLDPTDNSVGSSTLTYAADLDKGALGDGVPVTTTITTMAQNANYTFAATAGAHVTISISAANWGAGSALLYVFPPSGGPLFSHCAVVTTTTCEFTPDSTGTWKLQLDPQGSTVGNTTFALVKDQNKGALAIGTPITTTIATKGQNANYTFTATAGSQVKINVTSAAWGSGAARLYVFPPSGSPLFTNCTVTTPTSCVFTPTSGGTWQLQLDPLGDALGSTTFTRVT